jgi:hypothetical protein
LNSRFPASNKLLKIWYLELYIMNVHAFYGRSVLCRNTIFSLKCTCIPLSVCCKWADILLNCILKNLSRTNYRISLFLLFEGSDVA